MGWWCPLGLAGQLLVPGWPQYCCHQWVVLHCGPLLPQGGSQRWQQCRHRGQLQGSGVLGCSLCPKVQDLLGSLVGVTFPLLLQGVCQRCCCLLQCHYRLLVMESCQVEG